MSAQRDILYFGSFFHFSKWKVFWFFFINVNSLNCNQSKLEKYFKDDNLGSTHLGENLGEKFFTNCARPLVKWKNSWWNQNHLGEMPNHLVKLDFTKIKTIQEIWCILLMSNAKNHRSTWPTVTLVNGHFW